MITVGDDIFFQDFETFVFGGNAQADLYRQTVCRKIDVCFNCPDVGALFRRQTEASIFDFIVHTVAGKAER